MAKRSSGILVVNRQQLLRLALTNGQLRERQPAVAMTHENIFGRYRGFDGTAWPESERRHVSIVDGLARAADLDLVEDYVAKLGARGECDLLGLAISDGREFEHPDTRWRRAGFDVGFFESEWSHFSTILNEVIYGAHSELRVFADSLNDALLLETEEQVSALLTARDRAARAGADLEENEGGMQGIAIYVLREAVLSHG